MATRHRHGGSRQSGEQHEESRPLAPGDRAPEPQPEHVEPRLADPALGDLTRADWLAVTRRAGKEMLDDNMTMIASALAYSSFFAIPSVLLLAVGLFTLTADPSTITSLIGRLHGVMPGQATTLLSDSLHRLNHQHGASVTMTIVGFVLALWSMTGAMTSLMTALNLAYERDDGRGFVKKRLTALAMVGCIGVAFLLIAVLLIFGPQVETHLGSAVDSKTVVSVVWWTAQWPILIGGLFAAFATLLWLGPDVDPPRWRFVTPGTAIAVVLWLLVSALFALYTANFGSYNKTWGSLSAVIIMLTWLWLASLALLFGAEFNAELERTRELRRGQPAEHELQAPARG